MRQPIAGGAPSELTRFSDGQTTDFVWSPDGRRIAVVRKISGAQSVWLVDPRGGEPAKLAEFATGDIFGCRWSIDGKSVLFTYATSTQDVVLIKNVA
jgi:Tol biopolymer transport system component